jgi:hypothetical protein
MVQTTTSDPLAALTQLDAMLPVSEASPPQCPEPAHSVEPDRVAEILATLGSLSAELAALGRARGPAGEARQPALEGASFQRVRASSQPVRLNVGGKIFHVSWGLLLQVGRAGRIQVARASFNGLFIENLLLNGKLIYKVGFTSSSLIELIEICT